MPRKVQFLDCPGSNSEVRKIKMDLDEVEALEKVWMEPLGLGRIEENREQREQEKEKEKRLLFLGVKEVIPRGKVVFSNETFFVERSGGLITIRPRYVREYLRKIGTRRRNRWIKITRGAKPIIIPLIASENVEKWFEERYIRNIKKGQQGKFIEAVWKYRHEFLQEVAMG